MVGINLNDESGVASAIAFFGPTTSPATSFTASGVMTLVAGTNKGGTWRATIAIPAGTTGTHYVGFRGVDLLGNTGPVFSWAILQP